MPPDAARANPSHAMSRRRDAAFDAGSLRGRLRVGLDDLRLDASEAQADRLMAYLALLSKWNATYNLTSVRDPNDMLPVHVLDSLSVLPLIDRYEEGSVLDVGSGAGLPAIPLAILRPALRVETVDAVAKKIGFQRQVRSELAVGNLFPHHVRIEEFRPASLPSIVISRAYGDIAGLLASIDHLVTRSSTVIAMKGVEPTIEIAAVPPRWNVASPIALQVPLLGARRCAVVITRAAG